MCGRFALHNFYANRVADEYPDIPPRRWDDEEEFHPRYNVAPQTNVPVIMQQPNGQGQQEMIVQTMRWGLQAKWSDSSSFKNPINARSEVVLEGTANIWNSVRGSKHCIVVCEGYYEWLKKGTKKLPHYVKRPDGHLLLLAGFYEIVKPTDPPGKTMYTCTILTTEANDQLAFLHERMPVILNGEQAIKWMDVEKGWMPEVLEELRKPYQGQLVCYEVPDGVGKVGNEDPSFVEPLTERKDGLRAMMSRMAQKPKKEESDSPPKRKREPTQVLSDDSDIEADKPSPSKVPKQESPSKVTKQEPSPKSEPEEVVLDDDSDVEEVKPEPKSSPSKSSPVKKRRGGGRRPKRGSSPIEIDLTSGSDNDIQVDTGPKRIKVEESKPSPRRNEKKRPTKSTRPPDKKTIIDFFGKK